MKHGADIGSSDTGTCDFAIVAKGSVKSIFEATLLRNLVVICCFFVLELWVKVNFSCYFEGLPLVVGAIVVCAKFPMVLSKYIAHLHVSLQQGLILCQCAISTAVSM